MAGRASRPGPWASTERAPLIVTAGSLWIFRGIDIFSGLICPIMIV
jgi:hypothetical protein